MSQQQKSSIIKSLPTKSIIKEYKDVTAIVRTIDAKTNEVKNEQIRNIDGPERREWLKEAIFKASVWAMFNHCYVEVINKVDDIDE